MLDRRRADPAGAAGDRAALTRDLTVVATRPVGSTASASITFTVQR